MHEAVLCRYLSIRSILDAAATCTRKLSVSACSWNAVVSFMKKGLAASFPEANAPDVGVIVGHTSALIGYNILEIHVEGTPDDDALESSKELSQVLQGLQGVAQLEVTVTT